MEEDNIKCKCPFCGGRLEYWEEQARTRFQLVNLNGKISKSKERFSIDDLDTYGLRCDTCDTYWYGREYEDNKYNGNLIDKIFKLVINQNDI